MERDFVRWLTDRLPADERVTVGLGDDAAVLRVGEGMEVVATTDMLMDGVDFDLRQDEAERIGRKALAVNLSDLAAMAAKPLAALVSLALPRQGGGDLGRRLIEGMLPLAAEFQCPIAGGDTNSWNDRLVISVTALGEVPRDRRWLRSGALAGDAIVVTGTLGGSLLGKHFDFVPRVREALWLAEHYEVHAAMDVSDGLTLDLSRLCEASGCGAQIELSAIPVSSAATESVRLRGDGSSAIDHALSDGEDFELILVLPADAAASLVGRQPLGLAWTQIGKILPEAGLFSVDQLGRRAPLKPQGYEHRLDG